MNLSTRRHGRRPCLSYEFLADPWHRGAAVLSGWATEAKRAIAPRCSVPVSYRSPMLPVADEQGQPTAAISPMRATGVVGLGSAASLALSVIMAKAYALLVGPEGVGLLALMQAVMVVGVMVASVGLAASVVRAVAEAAEAGPDEVEAVGRSASYVGLVGGIAGAAAVIIFRDPLASFVLGDAGRGDTAIVLAVALGLAVAASVQIGILTGLHRVGEVVTVNVATSAAAAAVGIPLVAYLGEEGLAPALIVAAAAQLVISRSFAMRALGHGNWTGGIAAIARRSGGLVLRGAPVAGGQLAGSGALFIVPVIVLQVLQAAEVGYYRAAATVSVAYLTFFLAALTQDFYPRVARTTDQQGLSALIERRMRLIMGLGVPVIMALMAFGPWLIELLYSPDFAPAYGVLQWQLVGDLIRLPAWVFVFVLLARGGPWPYVGAELVAGVGVVIATIAGLQMLGLVGAGLGYAAAQLAYYVIALALVRRHVATTPGRLQAVVLATVVASSIVLASPVEQFAKSVVLGLVAVGFAAAAWPRLYRLHRAGLL